MFPRLSCLCLLADLRIVGVGLVCRACLLLCVEVFVELFEWGWVGGGGGIRNTVGVCLSLSWEGHWVQKGVLSK